MSNVISENDQHASSNPVSIAINILVSPSEAFAAIERIPSKLFPLILLLGSTAAALFWYFTIIDYSWYVDDTLTASGNLSEAEFEAAREGMLALSQSTFRIIGVVGGTLGALAIYSLQATYLSMVSALNGDKYRFGHWFSLICWTSLPALLSVIGMVVTLLMSPNGQISSFDLNPLTLTNLGMNSANSSMQSLFNIISLNMLWSLALMVAAYRQWLQASSVKAATVVLAPYALILGAWLFIAIA